MKIAVVFDQFLFGGIERVGINHIKLLKELGHEVDAYVLNPETEEMIEELKAQCSVKVLSFSKKLCPNRYWAITRRSKIGKYVFPLVFIFFSLAERICRLFLKQKPKYDLAIAFSGHFNDLTFVADNFIKAKKKACWLHGALYQYVLMSQGYEYLYKKIKNLVVLIDDCQNELLTYHRKDNFDFNICKIYNPITISDKPVDKKTVSELNAKYGDFILMVARLDPPKDPFTLIQAMKILKDKYKSDRKLVIVGDGPLRKQTENAIQTLELQDRIFLEGSRSNVQDYYSAASVLAHASTDGEGLPTIVIEALGMKTPVVCTDSKVGPREILGDGKYGLLCKVQDAESMAEKLNLILTNDILYSNLQNDGHERYKDFSPEEVKKKLNVFIEGLKND